MTIFSYCYNILKYICFKKENHYYYYFTILIEELYDDIFIMSHYFHVYFTYICFYHRKILVNFDIIRIAFTTIFLVLFYNDYQTYFVSIKNLTCHLHCFLLSASVNYFNYNKYIAFTIFLNCRFSSSVSRMESI